MIYESLFIVSVSQLKSKDMNNLPISPTAASLLNGMVFNVITTTTANTANTANTVEKDHYSITIVSVPTPSSYEMHPSYKNTQSDIDRKRTISHFNSGTLVSFYYHPYLKALRMSTSSSLDARYI